MSQRMRSLIAGFVLVLSLIIFLNVQVLICSAGTEDEIPGSEAYVSGIGLHPVFPVLSGLCLDNLIINLKSHRAQTRVEIDMHPQSQEDMHPQSQDRLLNQDPEVQSNLNSGKAETTPKSKDLFSQMERAVGNYNSGIDKVPAPLKKLAGNDIIRLDIGMKDNSKLQIKAVTEKGKIVEFRKLGSGEDMDASVSVYSDEDTFRIIMYSGDPLNVFVESLNNGQMSIKCDGLLKKGALLAVKKLA